MCSLVEAGDMKIKGIAKGKCPLCLRKKDSQHILLQ
jgi:hypothetical protein